MRFVAGLRRALLVTALVALVAVGDAQAYRLIQNTGVGRFSAGAAVSCSNPTGFTHWNSSSITWYRNAANQGNGKATAMQSAMASWTGVTPATYNLVYGGTSTRGFVTDGFNVALWASGNGCTGSCLAITALVLQSGQRIVETDISFNNNVTWTTTGSNYDTQAVMTHELGHALGIHHTQLTSTPRPTMYAYYFGSGGRSLESDDRSALNCIYNRYPPSAAQQIVAEAGGPDFDEAPALELAQPRVLSARPRPGGALLRYTLASMGPVRLQVFDLAGRELATLVDGVRPAGDHELAWDGSTSSGRLSSGVYFARLVSEQGEGRATVVLVQ